MTTATEPTTESTTEVQLANGLSCALPSDSPLAKLLNPANGIRH